MCTLILGCDVVAPGTLVLGANRDESPARPSDPPGVLVDEPRVVGGRDRTAGGTWLAIRERRAVVAMLNRRDEAPAPNRRSRGLLALDVAGVSADRDLAHAALERARAEAGRHVFAPFSLLFASPGASWLMVGTLGDPLRILAVGPGWHVITHADLDDRSEPRTAWLIDSLHGWSPRTREETERGLVERLSAHGGGAVGREVPAVCIHRGRMVTVSTSLVWLAPGGARYRHAEGRPCETPLTDFTPLLAGHAGAAEKR